MSSQHEGKSRPAVDRQDEAPEPEQPQSEATARAAEVSSSAEETIDDIDELLDAVDESLRASLGFGPGEVVDPAVIEARAEEMVRGYQQKGGQ
ncbi:hypothetical protein [Micromonospora fulviviridis]|uniref:hypothetical protein n=1 Tax=Micromonospora fulviviridis TaxID=47860 RepID=UPI003791855C